MINLKFRSQGDLVLALNMFAYHNMQKLIKAAADCTIVIESRQGEGDAFVRNVLVKNFIDMGATFDMEFGNPWEDGDPLKYMFWDLEYQYAKTEEYPNASILTESLCKFTQSKLATFIYDFMTSDMTPKEFIKYVKK